MIGWLVCTSMRKEYGRSIEICEGDNIICFDGRSLRSRPKMESGMRVYGRIIYYEPYKKFVFQKYPKETGSINGQMLNSFDRRPVLVGVRTKNHSDELIFTRKVCVEAPQTLRSHRRIRS